MSSEYLSCYLNFYCHFPRYSEVKDRKGKFIEFKKCKETLKHEIKGDKNIIFNSRGCSLVAC